MARTLLSGFENDMSTTSLHPELKGRVWVSIITSLCTLRVSLGLVLPASMPFIRSCVGPLLTPAEYTLLWTEWDSQLDEQDDHFWLGIFANLVEGIPPSSVLSCIKRVYANSPSIELPGETMRYRPHRRMVSAHEAVPDVGFQLLDLYIPAKYEGSLDLDNMPLYKEFYVYLAKSGPADLLFNENLMKGQCRFCSTLVAYIPLIGDDSSLEDDGTSEDEDERREREMYDEENEAESNEDEDNKDEDYKDEDNEDEDNEDEDSEDEDSEDEDKAKKSNKNKKPTGGERSDGKVDQSGKAKDSLKRPREETEEKEEDDKDITKDAKQQKLV